MIVSIATLFCNYYGMDTAQFFLYSCAVNAGRVATSCLADAGREGIYCV